MKDQEIFKQLHSLSKMKPNADWKKSQRNVMLSQINAGSTTLNSNSFVFDLFKLPFSYLQSFSQPIVATFLLAFLFLTGGFVGLRAAQDTKPGDSLYLAKIVGEKTQLALAFTEKKKAQLGIGFAVRRVEEIKQVIAEEEEDNDDTGDKVDQLLADFKKEIKAAKSRIAKISTTEKNDSIKEEESNITESGKTEEAKVEEDLDANIFSAGFDKTENGLEISDNNNNKETNENIVVKDDEKTLSKASSSDDMVSSSTIKEVLTIKTTSPESILQEASDLLQAESYSDALDTLDNAGTAVDKSFDMGEVKGVEESVSIDEEEVGVETGTSTKE